MAGSLVVSLIAAELAARVLFTHWREYHAGRFLETRLSPEGFSFTAGRPGFDGYFSENNGDFRIHIKLNERGWRAAEPTEAAAGRIWFVGDSFTFGWGVDIEDSFAVVAGALTRQPTYNLASPGTDLCGYRALMAMLPPTIAPQAVVVGLTLENDILAYDCDGSKPDTGGPITIRSRLITLKEMLTGVSALYNLAALSLKRFAVLRPILERIGLIESVHRERKSAIVSPTAIASTVIELQKMRASFLTRPPFAVLLIPTRLEIRDGHFDSRELRRRTAAELSAHGIDVVDPFPLLASAGFSETHFPHDGHWSAAGHRLAAEAVAQWVIKRLQAP